MTGARYAATLTIIGQTGKAIRFLQGCQQKFPANTTFPAMLAELYTQSNRMQDAIGVYDSMLRTDTLNFDAWYEKGLLLEKKGDTPDAILALKKAYTIEPINTYGLELAHLYAENRDAASLLLCDAALRKDSAHDLLDPFFIKGIYFSTPLNTKRPSCSSTPASAGIGNSPMPISKKGSPCSNKNNISRLCNRLK